MNNDNKDQKQSGAAQENHYDKVAKQIISLDMSQKGDKSNLSNEHISSCDTKPAPSKTSYAEAVIDECITAHEKIIRRHAPQMNNSIQRHTTQMPSGPVWIKHQPESEVFDGSQFACALQVNKGFNVNWEIHTLVVSTGCEGPFEISNLTEGDACDSHGAWSWDDFEFVFPLNHDAKKSIKELWIQTQLTEDTPSGIKPQETITSIPDKDDK